MRRKGKRAVICRIWRHRISDRSRNHLRGEDFIPVMNTPFFSNKVCLVFCYKRILIQVELRAYLGLWFEKTVWWRPSFFGRLSWLYLWTNQTQKINSILHSLNLMKKKWKDSVMLPFWNMCWFSCFSGPDVICMISIYPSRFDLLFRFEPSIKIYFLNNEK